MVTENQLKLESGNAIVAVARKKKRYLYVKRSFGFMIYRSQIVV